MAGWAVDGVEGSEPALRTVESAARRVLVAGPIVPLMPAPVPATKELRVAVLAPISWRTPPRHYGPWEQFASLLTEGLVSVGVDVTLFATADSVTTAHLGGTTPT